MKHLIVRIVPNRAGKLTKKDKKTILLIFSKYHKLIFFDWIIQNNAKSRAVA